MHGLSPPSSVVLRLGARRTQQNHSSAVTRLRNDAGGADAVNWHRGRYSRGWGRSFSPLFLNMSKLGCELRHRPIREAEGVLRPSPAALAVKGAAVGACGSRRRAEHRGPVCFPDRDLSVSTCQPQAHAKPPCLFCLKATSPRGGGGEGGEKYPLGFNCI